MTRTSCCHTTFQKSYKQSVKVIVAVKKITYIEGSRYWSLRCDVTLVRIGGLHVVGIDVVAAPLGNSFDLDTRVFIRPNVVVAILRPLLDNFARQGLLHPLLFALFDLQEPVCYCLAVVLLIRCCLEPLWKIAFD
jgi:hypothetical protein